MVILSRTTPKNALTYKQAIITTTRFIGPQSAEEIVAYLDAMNQVRAAEQERMHQPQATGSLDVDNSIMGFFYGPEDVVAIAGVKLLAAVPFIVKGVKWSR